MGGTANRHQARRINHADDYSPSTKFLTPSLPIIPANDRNWSINGVPLVFATYGAAAMPFDDATANFLPFFDFLEDRIE